MKLSIIVAMDKNGLIGQNGELPWRLPTDLNWFKSHTINKGVIFGRKTYDSIGSALPNRDCVVLSRDIEFDPDDVAVYDNLRDGLTYLRNHEEVMIAGGAYLYQCTLRQVDRIYVTFVDTEIEPSDNDTHFQNFSTDGFELKYEEVAQGPDDEYPMRFCIYDRI